MIKRHFEGEALINELLKHTQKNEQAATLLEMRLLPANPSSHSLAGKGVKKGGCSNMSSIAKKSELLFRDYAISKKVGILHVLNVLERGLHVFLQHLVTLLFGTQFVCKRGFTHGVKKHGVKALKSCSQIEL